MYPTGLTSQLKASDSVIKYVPITYGWWIFKKQSGYVALTEERVIYSARMAYTESSSVTDVLESGNLPISKISSMSTKQITTGGCIFKRRIGVLSINMQGAIYNIVVGKEISAVKPLITEFTART